MTFNELLALFEDATPAERQRVLDMIPQVARPLDAEKSKLSRELWDAALRAVFEAPKQEIDDGLDVTTERTDQGVQLVIPGAERSACQAAAARGDKMRSRRVAVQLPPGGMFEPKDPEEPSLFH